MTESVAMLMGNDNLASKVRFYPELRLIDFLRQAAIELVNHDQFKVAAAAHLGPSDAEQAQLPVLMKKFGLLCGL